MTEITLFASSFVMVFALGIQQLNVQGGHYYLAVATSFVIGGAQIYLWHVMPDANASEIIATLLGGPTAIVLAMWSHPRFVKLLKGKRAK